jgi:hypothetical protein
MHLGPKKSSERRRTSQALPATALRSRQLSVFSRGNHFQSVQNIVKPASALVVATSAGPDRFTQNPDASRDRLYPKLLSCHVLNFLFQLTKAQWLSKSLPCLNHLIYTPHHVSAGCRECWESAACFCVTGITASCRIGVSCLMVDASYS